MGVEYYQTYFATIEKIMRTTLEILRMRVFSPSNSSLRSSNIPIQPSATVQPLVQRSCRLIVICTADQLDLSQLPELHKRVGFVDDVILVGCSNASTESKQFSVAHSDLSARLSKPGCAILLSSAWLRVAIDLTEWLQNAFRLWQDNPGKLVGFNGLSYTLKNGCFRPSLDLSNGYSFLGLELTFLNSSYLEIIFNLSRMWNNCSSGLGFDQVSTCLMPLLNLVVIKTVQRDPCFLIRPNGLKLPPSFDYQSICLNDLFENVFELSDLYFQHYVSNKYKYFS